MNKTRAASGMRRIGQYAVAGLFCLAAAIGPRAAMADEGGVSFWLPGNFGSLAAAPGVPGWAWATIYIHSDVAAGAGQQFPRGGRVDGPAEVVQKDRIHHASIA